MPLTPADIHNVEFRKPALGKRGYDEEQVDAFLDEAEQEVARLTAENRALRERLRRSGPAPADLAAEIERLRAEQARAEREAREAQAELDRARADQKRTTVGGERVVAVAQRTADAYLRDARREAEELLGKARAKADQVTSEAQLNASTIDSDARHRHTEAVNSLAERRAAVLAEINELDSRARKHRERLRDQVNQRLQALVGP